MFFIQTSLIKPTYQILPISDSGGLALFSNRSGFIFKEGGWLEHGLQNESDLGL